MASEEGIATNVLANRLTWLEENGILSKTPNETDKRKDLYVLTEKGLDLIPILLEIASWSAKYDPQTGAPQEWIALVNADKEQMIRRIQKTVRRGGAIFTGPNNVVSQWKQNQA